MENTKTLNTGSMVMATTEEHKCVDRVNDQLKSRNTRLSLAFSLAADRELIMLATEKADPSVRKKPVLFFANYCPMCGVKLRGAAC